MLKAIKRIAKRIFIIILVVFAIYLVISNIDLIRDLASKEKINVAIDADAANGYDDVLAIYRLFVDKDVEIRGLTSAQWRLADLDNDSSVQSNSTIHSFFLETFYKTRIPYPEGTGLPLKYTLKKDDQVNMAARAIKKIVQELPYQQKLNMICIGSATNLATAIRDSPEIADKIVCYILGPGYDPSRRSWNKNDPVTRLDLEAMDILLNEEQLDIHLLPANVASGLFITRSEFNEEFPQEDSLQKFISHHCFGRGSMRDTLSGSSLALVEAFRNPDMSTQKQLITPPENTQRKIYVYTRIDPERMKKEFWKSLQDKSK